MVPVGRVRKSGSDRPNRRLVSSYALVRSGPMSVGDLICQPPIEWQM